MQNVSVHQGECRVSSDPNVMLTTVLGSCVAVCLHDPEAKVGGMNHFLLPGGGSGDQRDMRFGVNSMELLINDMLKRGAQRFRLQAQLFGGGQILKNRSMIGKSNVEFAQGFITRERIPCVSSDLGGVQARRLNFTPSTGLAKCTRVTAPADLEKTAPAPRRPAPPSDVTLF